MVRLKARQGDSPQAQRSTAFGVQLSWNEQIRYLLVTSGHLVEDRAEVEVHLRSAFRSSGDAIVSEPILLPPLAQWVSSERGADLVAVDVSDLVSAGRLPSELFIVLADETMAPPQDAVAPVAFIGFGHGDDAEPVSGPTVTMGRLASPTRDPAVFEGTEFLIAAKAAAGCSGSPLYLVSDTCYLFAGVVRGEWPLLTEAAAAVVDAQEVILLAQLVVATQAA